MLPCTPGASKNTQVRLFGGAEAQGGERKGFEIGVNAEAKKWPKEQTKTCSTSQRQYGKATGGSRVSRGLEPEPRHGDTWLCPSPSLTQPTHHSSKGVALASSAPFPHGMDGKTLPLPVDAYLPQLWEVMPKAPETLASCWRMAAAEGGEHEPAQLPLAKAFFRYRASWGF